MFSFPGSCFPGTRDSRLFSFPDSRELKRRHSRRKAGTSRRQLVIKWDARQWLQRVQTSLAGQLTAAGSRCIKHLCCVHYRVWLVAVAALQDSYLSPLFRVRTQSCSWHCVHRHWRRRCQRWQTMTLPRTSVSVCYLYDWRPWRPNARSPRLRCFAPNCVLVWTTAH